MFTEYGNIEGTNGVSRAGLTGAARFFATCEALRSERSRGGEWTADADGAPLGVEICGGAALRRSVRNANSASSRPTPQKAASQRVDEGARIWAERTERKSSQKPQIFAMAAKFCTAKQK